MADSISRGWTLTKQSWAVAVVIVIGIISSALTEIFRVAVYQYAVTGETSAGFDGRLLQTAFDGHRRRL